MFTLFGKIRVSAAEARGDMAKAGAQLSKDFGQQFKSGVMRFVGAGALISLVQNRIAQAVEASQGAARLGISPEAFQELSAAAKYLGVSVEDLKAGAITLGKPFEDFMNLLRAQGGFLDDAAVNSLLQLSQAFNQVLTKLNPVISFAMDWGGRLYKFFGGEVEALVGAGMFASGVFNRDQAMIDAANQMIDEQLDKGFSDLTTPTSLAAPELDRFARQILQKMDDQMKQAEKDAAELKETLSP